MPASPALPGTEGVEAPRWAQAHRRSTMNAVRKRAQLPARDAATTVAAHPTRHNELSQRIAALNGLTAQQLRDEWRRLYRGQPPRLSRDLLIRTIAYRMQELAYGGLSKATQRKLDTLTKELRRKGAIVITPDAPLKPGTRLVREWRGTPPTGVVAQDGVEESAKPVSPMTKKPHWLTPAH